MRKSTGFGYPPRHPSIDRTWCLHLGCYIWLRREANKERLPNMGARSIDRETELTWDGEQWLPRKNEVSVELLVEPCVVEWRVPLKKINKRSS